VSAKDKYSISPLHYAAVYSDLSIVKLLVSKGADINAKTDAGEIPLDAAKKKKIEVATDYGRILMESTEMKELQRMAIIEYLSNIK